MQNFLSIRILTKALRLLCLVFLFYGLGGDFSASAQRLRIQDDLDFGLVDFSALSGRARLGTDSSITYTGGASGDGIGTAGRFRITGQSGTTVDISCTKNGKISNGTDIIRIRGVELFEGTTGVPYGGTGAIRCDGLGSNILQLVSGNQNSNRALIGARMLIDGDETDGSYDTLSSGGDPLVIEMVIP
ncbi:MAG: DUF4402 domain-containing protein [Alphaproteobacteria bacterium]|nr:DUF4402 domain-containing protein [Alphaproteobacteria bacterium]